MRLILKFFRLKNSEKRLIIEVIFFLFISRMAIILLPYKVLKAMLGTYKKISNGKETDSEIIKRASYWIRRISPLLPWKCNCLPQAVTGRFVLKIRKIESTLYLGMSKDNEKKLIAHAWLKVGDIPVTGGRDNSEFAEVAYFG